MSLNPYSVNIIGLSNRSHTFSYELSDEFNAGVRKILLFRGKFNAEVVLNKHETFIEAEFKVVGQTTLVCDRSLDPFDFPVTIDKKVVFKYGEEEMELSDEIIIITRDTTSLNCRATRCLQYIILEIPMRKLHPRFQEEEENDENEEGKVIYTSSTDTHESEDDHIDPRWE